MIPLENTVGDVAGQIVQSVLSIDEINQSNRTQMANEQMMNQEQLLENVSGDACTGKSDQACVYNMVELQRRGRAHIHTIFSID